MTALFSTFSLTISLNNETIAITIMNIERFYIMKTKVKVFRWNEVKNVSEVKIHYFDDSKKFTKADLELRKIIKNTYKKELVK